MNKSVSTLVGLAVFLGLIIYFAVYQGQYFDWNTAYQEDGKSPYDIRILRRLLTEQFELIPFEERMESEISLEREDIASTSYLYVGDCPKYSEDEAWHLKQYVIAGGNAFIIANNLPDSLEQFLFFAEDCQEDNIDDLELGDFNFERGRFTGISSPKVLASFKHPSLAKNSYEFEYYYGDNVSKTYWSFFSANILCASEQRAYPIAALGEFEIREKNTTRQYLNFVRLKVGKGYFYFHRNPIMFSNYYLVDKAGLEYAENVFSHIPTSKIFWDKKSEKYPKQTRKRARSDIPAQSPLEYIFSQTSLRWSWYLCLSVGLLFVLFRAKRKQRRIPIIEINRNTSLEFIETIGTLYFQQQDHKGIIKKQMHLFLAHLRQRYNLVTNDLDDVLIERIVVRSRVDKHIVEDIFKEYFRLKKYLDKSSGTISVEILNNFYVLVERFYQAEKKNKFERK